MSTIFAMVCIFIGGCFIGAGIQDWLTERRAEPEREDGK